MKFTLCLYQSGDLIPIPWGGDKAPATLAAAKRAADRVFNAPDGPEGVAVKDEAGRVLYAAVSLGEDEEEE